MYRKTREHTQKQCFPREPDFLPPYAPSHRSITRSRGDMCGGRKENKKQDEEKKKPQFAKLQRQNPKQCMPPKERQSQAPLIPCLFLMRPDQNWHRGQCRTKQSANFAKFGTKRQTRNENFERLETGTAVESHDKHPPNHAIFFGSLLRFRLLKNSTKYVNQAIKPSTPHNISSSLTDRRECRESVVRKTSAEIIAAVPTVCGRQTWRS